MRVELEHLDLRGFAVDVSPSHAEVEQKIRVREATGIAGRYEQFHGLTRLEQVVAERLVLDALALLFGTVWLREQGAAAFEEVRAAFTRDAHHTSFDLEAASVHAMAFSVDIEAFHVGGETRLRDLHLTVRDGEGRLQASSIDIARLRGRRGDLRFAADRLAADGVHMAWGADGLRIEAAALEAPKIEVVAGNRRMHGAGLVVRGLRVYRGDVAFSSAELASSELDLALDPTPAVQHPAGTAAAQQPMSEQPKLLDFALFDGLSGELNVDASVDMSVPVIGRRRATHRLRLGIEDGSIDYRELESGLAGLEESLLDFSVRSGVSALVLELGIPLLPTRGLGKPLVLWELGAEDLILAERRRVRLSVLPSFRLPGQERKSEPPRDPEATSNFALRTLHLENIDVRLSLNAVRDPLNSMIRGLSFDSLLAQGTVRHDAQEGMDPHSGAIRIQASGLEIEVGGLTIGGSIVDFSKLQLAELPDVRLSFLGLTLTRVRAEVRQLVFGVTQVRTTPPPPAARSNLTI